MNAVMGLVGMGMTSVNALVIVLATALTLGVVAFREFKKE